MQLHLNAPKICSYMQKISDNNHSAHHYETTNKTRSQHTEGEEAYLQCTKWRFLVHPKTYDLRPLRRLR